MGSLFEGSPVRDDKQKQAIYPRGRVIKHIPLFIIMQTFLPYPNFYSSLSCLDNKRLGKQRVEALQIYKCLMGIPTKKGTPYKGWINHPAVKMWKGYEEALSHYHNQALVIWLRRGYTSNMEFLLTGHELIYPPWLGNKDLHASHRSNLLRKNPEWYKKFNWKEPNNLPYWWPCENGRWPCENGKR